VQFDNEVQFDTPVRCNGGRDVPLDGQHLTMQNEVQTEADNVISGAWLEWNSTDLPSSVVREVLRFYGPWMNDNANMGDHRDCLFTKFRDCPPAFRNVVRLQLAIHYRLPLRKLLPHIVTS
jgi:hypothetical protein